VHLTIVKPKKQKTPVGVGAESAKELPEDTEGEAHDTEPQPPVEEQ
jgi:hypothetical protein